LTAWSAPQCDDCWDRLNPSDPSPRTAGGPPEACVHCGNLTVSGIYVRGEQAAASRAAAWEHFVYRLMGRCDAMAGAVTLSRDELAMLSYALGNFCGWMRQREERDDAGA
jgi:hypothetical protein